MRRSFISSAGTMSQQRTVGSAPEMRRAVHRPGAGAGRRLGDGAAAHPQTGRPYAWIVRSTAIVHQSANSAVDQDFGPFSFKFCSSFPYAPPTYTVRSTLELG